MSVCRRVIKGEKYWVIDRTVIRADGVKERYRRVAHEQSRGAAEKEEREIIAFFEAHGTIAPLLKPERPAAPAAPVETAAVVKRDPKKVPTWDDAVTHYKDVELPKKKVSTRKGYETLLDGPHMRRWNGVALEEITRAAMNKWDTALATYGMEASTRRNHHIVLRSVLKSVGPIDGEPGLLIQALPAFPKLPVVGQKAVEGVDPTDLAKLLNERDDEKAQPVWSARRRKARLAFALGGVAGMRASEIRGLRRRDVDLRRETITIRRARVHGEEDTPKSGHDREIPIAPLLLPLLKAACDGLRPEDYVATTHEGTPWSDNGIWAALRRACERLGISRARVHGLRHHFATALFESSTDARTVQDLLGHSDLSTTQRYAHTNKARAKAALSVFAAVLLTLVGCVGAQGPDPSCDGVVDCDGEGGEPNDDDPKEEPSFDVPTIVPSCRPRTYVTEVELHPGESADLEVYCRVGTATTGTCTPDGTGLMFAGFVVADGGDYVGYRCEVHNDGEAVRRQTAEVTCCNSPR